MTVTIDVLIQKLQAAKAANGDDGTIEVHFIRSGAQLQLVSATLNNGDQQFLPTEESKAANTLDLSLADSA